MKILSTIALTAYCLLIMPGTGMAQKLDAFEKGTRTTSPEKATSDYHHRNSCADDFFSEVIGDVIGVVIVGGGAMSWTKARANTNACLRAGIMPKEAGDRQIPFLRTDITYQALGSGVEAFDYRAEMGYGPIGLHFDQTHYSEDDPRDRLDLTRVYGLYRMAMGDSIEMDLGFGPMWIDGNKKDARTSFTVPIMVYPNDVFGIEFRPAWASNISDYDIGFLISGKHSSFKAGYRWVKSPGKTLDGPYAGIALHF